MPLQRGKRTSQLRSRASRLSRGSLWRRSGSSTEEGVTDRTSSLYPVEPRAAVGVTMGCLSHVLSSRVQNEFIVDTLDVIHTHLCASLK